MALWVIVESRRQSVRNLACLRSMKVVIHKNPQKDHGFLRGKEQKMSRLGELPERFQRMAILKASGVPLKEIAAETGYSYESVRTYLAPNGASRNQKVLDVVAELKEEMALSIKGLPNIMLKRIKSEIECGEAETAHHYMKIGRDLIRDLGAEEEEGNHKQLPGIKNLIQNFVMQKQESKP